MSADRFSAVMGSGRGTPAGPPPQVFMSYRRKRSEFSWHSLHATDGLVTVSEDEGRRRGSPPATSVSMPMSPAQLHELVRWPSRRDNKLTLGPFTASFINSGTAGNNERMFSLMLTDNRGPEPVRASTRMRHQDLSDLLYYTDPDRL